MNKWQVRGYSESRMDCPDHLQEYDGYDQKDDDGVPPVVLKHLRAMVEKDKVRNTCQFAEIVDMDVTLNIQGDESLGVPNEQKFKTVRCKER